MSSRAGRVARVDGTNALERPLNLQHRTNTIFAHRDFRGGLLFDRLGVSAALAAADTPFTIFPIMIAFGILWASG
jgi:hypothetical protein